MKYTNTRRGFTLIELLVVVIIIAILAAIALPQYQKAVLKARVAEIQTFIAHMEKAADLYVLENGYPSSGSQKIPWDELGIDVSNFCSTKTEFYCITKNFRVYTPTIYPDRLDVTLETTTLGPSSANITIYKNGTKEKQCTLMAGSLEGKPVCEALKANDSSWSIDLGSGAY